MNEFKVNDYITLKLERDQTNIYVEDQLFNQCKYLLTNLPHTSEEVQTSINSVDDVAEQLGWTDEGQKQEGEFVEVEIPPEVEFWGHCSNLQVWVENDYNPNLLHSSIALPLLKKLTEVGDHKAKFVFEDEIFEKFFFGNTSLYLFLLESEYLRFVSLEKMKLNIDKYIKSADVKSIAEVLDKFHDWVNSYYYLRQLTKSDEPYFGERILMDIVFDNFNISKLKTKILKFIKERENLNSVFMILKKYINWSPSLARNLIKKDIIKENALNIPSMVSFLIKEGYITDIPPDFIISALKEPECLLIEDIFTKLQDRFETERIKAIYQFKLLENFMPNEKKLKINQTIKNEEQSLKWRFHDSPFYKKEFGKKGIMSMINLIEEEKEKYWKSLNPSYYNLILEIESLTRIKTRPIKYADELYNREEIGVLIKNKTITGLYITFYKEDTLDYFKLDFIPEIIRKISSLEVLYFTNGNVSKIPEWLCEMRDLRELHLDYNNIKEVPPCLGNLVKLEKLSLRGNRLTTLPETMKSLKLLHSLDLDSNILRSIPSATKHLTNLKYLCFNNNFISKIENLEYLTKLWILNLRQTLIPEDLINKLGGIYINTGSVNIPQNFVNYSYNKLLKRHPHLQSEYVTIRGEKYFVQNGVLNLSLLSLKSIDEIVGLEDLRELRTLDLTMNKLTHLSSLEQVKTLKKLILNLNEITELNGIEVLEELESLIVGVDLIRKLDNLGIINKKLDVKDFKEIINPNKVVDYYRKKFTD